MSVMFSVAAPEGLRPDPDENSAPIATLDPSDLVSVDKTLDPWTKVTLTKAGLPLSGWLISADLIPVQQATVRLFDEPLGQPRADADGPHRRPGESRDLGQGQSHPAGRIGASGRLERGRSRRARRGRPQQACWTARQRSGNRARPLPEMISFSGRTTAIAPRCCKPNPSPASTPPRSRRSLTLRRPKSAAAPTRAFGTPSRATQARALAD